MLKLKNICGALFICAAATMANISQAGQIFLAASSTDVSVGDTVSVDVILENPFAGSPAGDALLAFGFDVNFDVGGLSLASQQVAAPWDDDSAFFPNTDVAGSNFPGINNLGQSEILLATLVFDVIADGDFFLNVLSDSANNFNQGLLYLSGIEDINASTMIRVSDVPEPSMLALMLLAVGGLAARRNRKV